MAIIAQALFDVGSNTTLSSYTPDSGFGGFVYDTSGIYVSTAYQARSADDKCYLNHANSPRVRCTSNVTNTEFEYYADVTRASSGNVMLVWFMGTEAVDSGQYLGMALNIVHINSTTVRWNLYYDANDGLGLCDVYVDGTTPFSENHTWNQNTAKRMGVTYTGGLLSVWEEPAGGGTRTTYLTSADVDEYYDYDNDIVSPVDTSGQRFGFQIETDTTTANIDNLTVNSLSSAQPNPFAEGIPGPQTQYYPRLPLWYGADSEDLPTATGGTFAKSVALSAVLFTPLVEEYPSDGHPLGVPRPDYNPTLKSLSKWYGEFDAAPHTMAMGNDEGRAPVIPQWNWSWRLSPQVDPDPKLPTRKLVGVGAVLFARYTQTLAVSAVLRKSVLKTVGLTARLATRVTKTVGCAGVVRTTLTKLVGLAAVLSPTVVTRTKLVGTAAVLRKSYTKTVGVTAVKVWTMTTVTKSVGATANLTGTVPKSVGCSAVLVAPAGGIPVVFKRFQARSSRR